MTDETYEMLEDAIQNQLLAIRSFEHGSKEEGEVVNRAATLIGLLTNVDKNSAEYQDKEERRRIDENRNIEANQIEREKQKLTWGRVGLELAKVVVPTGLSLIGYNVFQKRLMKFEETGRVSSTAGRELHLPSFFKK